jgi:hypothetical protein
MSKLVRVAALAALLLTPFAVRAEQAAAPADSAPAQAAMPCPHAGKAGCCGGACPGMQAQAGGGGPAAAGGCPCQKARAAAAKAAEAAKPGQQ